VPRTREVALVLFFIKMQPISVNWFMYFDSQRKLQQAWKFTVLRHNLTEQNLFTHMSHVALLAMVRPGLGINIYAK